YYDRLVDQYGHDPRACDASSKESLDVRYRVLSEVMDLSGKSVLEVGAGFGDFGAYLRGRFSAVQYTGIDISTRMIEEGRKAYPDLQLYRQSILEVEPSRQFDIVLAQGIFYLLGDNAEEKMYILIRRMLALAREAISFSTICAWAQEKNEA